MHQVDISPGEGQQLAEAEPALGGEEHHRSVRRVDGGHQLDGFTVRLGGVLYPRA